MSEDNPFIIKVPKGATEIDLGPILRPIIFAIKDNDLLDPEEIEAYWRKGKENLSYRSLLPTISRQMVYDYLKNNGWVDEESPPRGFCFIRDYQLKQHAWDRHGPWIRFSGGNERKTTIHNTNDVIRQMVSPLRKTKLELARAIIANGNILDRIANELG